MSFIYNVIQAVKPEPRMARDYLICLKITTVMDEQMDYCKGKPGGNLRP